MKEAYVYVNENGWVLVTKYNHEIVGEFTYKTCKEAYNHKVLYERS